MVRIFNCPAQAVLLAAVTICGCATIINGPKARIDVIGPDSVTILQEGVVPAPIYKRRDSSRYILLSRNRSHMLVVRSGTQADTLFMEPELNGWWIVPDLCSYGIGLVVDGLTGSWCEFDNDAIAYVVVDSIAGTQSPAPGWRALPSDLFEQTSPRSEPTGPARPMSKPRGIVLLAAIGGQTPFVQVPIGPTYFSIGFGFKVFPWLTVLPSYEGRGCTDLSDYTGNARTSGACDLTVQTLMLDTRFFLTTGWFLSGSIGRSTVDYSVVILEPDNNRLPGFNTGIPSAGFGLGYAWNVGFIEYRLQYGTERITLSEGSSAALRFNTFRFGLNINL